MVAQNQNPIDARTDRAVECASIHQINRFAADVRQAADVDVVAPPTVSTADFAFVREKPNEKARRLLNDLLAEAFYRGQRIAYEQAGEMVRGNRPQYITARCVLPQVPEDGVYQSEVDGAMPEPPHAKPCPRCGGKLRDGFCDPCHDRDRYDDSHDGDEETEADE